MTSVDTSSVKNFKAPKWNGHVHVAYVIGASPEGPIKIGQSADVARRLRSLQTGNPLPLMVFAVRLVMPRSIPSGSRVDTLNLAKQSAAKVEKYIHVELGKIGLRMIGEWFDISAAEAVEVIEKLSERSECRAMGVSWLATHEARMHPEYGFINSSLLTMAMDAKAQADAANQLALTFSLGRDNLSISAGS